MTEQQEYYTFTKDVKTLIQYAQEQAFDHLVIEAAERLNKASKKDLKGYGIPVTSIKESKDFFEEEKQQYAEDSRAHEKPWELWQYAVKNRDMLDWCDLSSAPIWKDHLVYRRKQNVFVPEYYSGLNWRDAEHLIGKTVECTTNPDCGWAVGTLKIIAHMNDTHFGMTIDNHTYFYNYIRTCEKTFKHPTINICGVELPKPETVAPSNGEQYWLSHAGGEPGYILFWNNDDDDISALKECRIHLTKERAQAWADWWKSIVIDKMK